MISKRLRRIPATGAHRPHGTSWALARGVLHAIAPDPSAPGPIRGLEQEAAFHLHAAHAVALGSAPRALELCFGALRLPPDSVVLAPALAAPWIPAAVERAGLNLRLVDVDPGTLHMDPESLRRTASAGAAAVLVAHTAGVPCDLDALGAACDGLDLPMIELFGMAIGARWRTRPVGAHGRVGVADPDSGLLSPFGGALLASDDRDLVARLRHAVAELPDPTPLHIATRMATGHLQALLAHPAAFGLLSRHGLTGSAQRRGDRVQSRIHPAQAEALRTAIAAHETHVDAGRERAAQLRWALPQDAWRQEVPDGALPAWSQLLVRVRDREACVATARAAGVQLNPDALHDLSAGACAHAAAAARECLAVPCLAQLREQDMERVAAALSGWHISEST